MAHPELDSNPRDPLGINPQFFGNLEALAKEMTVENPDGENSFVISVNEGPQETMIERLVMQCTVRELGLLFKKTKSEERKAERKIIDLVMTTDKTKALTKKRETLIYRMLLVMMRTIYREALQRAKNECEEFMD